jgi:hypothetical protein
MGLYQNNKVHYISKQKLSWTGLNIF